MTNRLHTIDEVRLLAFPKFPSEAGELCVYEGSSEIPYDIARTFSICAPKGATRGDHAHYKCSQVVICVHGVCEVVCSDGKEIRKFKLKSANQGLLIPPTIWAGQAYMEENTVLVVLCDRAYETDDYIRNYDTFVSFRSENDQ